MILTCTCQDSYQDQLYGKGLRVMNMTTATPPTYRCAKCLKVHGTANSETTKVAVKVTNTDKK